MLHRQFSELVDSVSDQIISYHETIILTVILQDTHSHNWTDHRPFFEVTVMVITPVFHVTTVYICCIPGLKNVLKKCLGLEKMMGFPFLSELS